MTVKRSGGRQSTLAGAVADGAAAAAAAAPAEGEAAEEEEEEEEDEEPLRRRRSSSRWRSAETSSERSGRSVRRYWPSWRARAASSCEQTIGNENET